MVQVLEWTYWSDEKDKPGRDIWKSGINNTCFRQKRYIHIHFSGYVHYAVIELFLRTIDRQFMRHVPLSLKRHNPSVWSCVAVLFRTEKYTCEIISHGKIKRSKTEKQKGKKKVFKSRKTCCAEKQRKFLWMNRHWSGRRAFWDNLLHRNTIELSRYVTHTHQTFHEVYTYLKIFMKQVWMQALY